MKRKLRRWLRGIGIAILLVAIGWIFLPQPQLYPEDLTWSRAVLDRNGGLLHISTASDSRYRLRISLDRVSQDWKDATLAKEDRWFHWHPGVNPFAVVRAAWGVITGRPAGGASTITMQVARLRWKIDSTTAGGKLVQMFRAIQLERHYSKDEILEAYFNLAPYGGNVEGAGAAARLWCGRDASQVTKREAIALSIIPQSPASRHPGKARDAERIMAAQARLAALLETDDQLRADPLSNSFTLSPDGAPPHEAPHFCRRIMRENPEPTIHSTLDPSMQNVAENGIAAYIERTREKGVVNACAILVHALSREVLAYVGSADYANREIHGMVDGLRGLRSPGSAVKPFIFGLAMDQGLIHPNSLLIDGPITFRDYNPENFEREFLGPIHAGEALVRSRNIPAVALSNRLTGGGLYQFLQASGAQLPHPPGHYGLALTLGGFGISPETVASLYAALVDDGIPKPLVFSNKKSPPLLKDPLLSPQSRFLVLEMLRGAAGLGIDDNFSKNHPLIAWKTGTSHGFRDAWSVGVSGDYVLVVWLGNFNGRGNNALVGRTCAVPLMFDLFSRLQLPEKAVAPPEDVRHVDLCAASGDLPGPWCTQVSSGWFIPGVSPISLCQIHRQILVDGATGLRVARDDGRPDLRREVHEFWSPDMLELFRKAGLPRRAPPEPENRTDTLAGIDHGKPPQIISPLAGRTYQSDDASPISLQARASSGVAKCYWFSGEAFLGTSDSGGTLSWQPIPGKHLLRVIDDHGRSAEMPVRVEADAKIATPEF